MKKFLLVIMTIALLNCSSDSDPVLPQDIPEATIIGRWNIVGFEGNVLYEFTENKRYTFYSDDGTFPTLEEALTEQPNLIGLDWYYEGDQVTVDLNFGNFSTLTPEFVCDNQVINWLDDNQEIHSVYFREGYVLATCDLFD
jgi:opacity protein-like surface antigen